MSEKVSIVKRLLFGLFAIVVAFGMSLYLVSPIQKKESNKSDIKLIDPLFVSKADYKGTMSFEMLEFDLMHGIANEEVVSKAKHNVTFYFDQVSNQCRELKDVDFFMCAGGILGEYFYYTPSTELSNNLAKQQSDCDLNSYLIYDAAQMAGIDAYVVYAPFHAFIGWDDGNGMQYLETTGNGDNHAVIADLTDKLYPKTFDRSYYTPESGDLLYRVYQALVFDLVSEPSYIESVSNPEKNTLIYDAQYQHKLETGRLTEKDVLFLESQLRVDITSVAKKMTLAHWYQAQGQLDKTKEMLGSIPLKSCYYDCMTIKREVSLWWNSILAPVEYYVRYAASKGVDVDQFDYVVFLLLGLGILVLLGSMILASQKKNTKQKQGESATH